MMDGLSTITRRAFTRLLDALANRGYSTDFSFVRSNYLRNRTALVCGLFLLLMPFWTLLDWLMLAPETRPYTLAGRIAMAVTLILVLLLTRQKRPQLRRTRLACGLLLAAPALFYALVLIVSPASNAPLIGYSFIPYMLVVMLAIFPFTLLESFTLGLMLLGLEAFALFTAGSLTTLQGVQDIWLLAALLSIAITANYFQLSLMLRLHREATHDPLTGLLNRGALRRSMLQITTRRPAPRAALLMMDLDYFKRINDTHGHLAGDDVLCHFAERLTQAARPGDILARYGGEEFIAVLMNTDLDTAVEVAERIRRQTETTPLQLRDDASDTVSYTVSIGVSMLEPGNSFEAAVHEADSRLYEAKRQARNCVVAV